MHLDTLPHFDQAMQRIEAWFENEIIDRPPVRFMGHNAFANQEVDFSGLTAAERKARWYDPEYQIDRFVQALEGRVFQAETFPVYWPNLGPDVYAAFYGARLHFGEVTSWSEPLVREWHEIDCLQLDLDNEYLRKLDELTAYALDRCAGKALVGYTDLHPGLDCAAAWRDPQQLCLDLLDSPDEVHRLAELAIADFETIYNHFDDILKAHGQLSVSWMGIPSYGRMHIPSCDFSNLISPALFNEFALPILQREVRTMTHNIFHIDGKRVARHLDAILSVPEVHALQWVQGVGDDQPIMQWVPFIRALQASKKPLIIDLQKYELDDFMASVHPKGLFLWIATANAEEEKHLLKKIGRWH
jgi:hypothetical protein